MCKITILLARIPNIPSSPTHPSHLQRRQHRVVRQVRILVVAQLEGPPKLMLLLRRLVPHPVAHQLLVPCSMPPLQHARQLQLLVAGSDLLLTHTRGVRLLAGAQHHVARVAQVGGVEAPRQQVEREHADGAAAKHALRLGAPMRDLEDCGWQAGV